VVFLPSSSSLGCTGALSASLYSGGKVINASVTVRISQTAIYKMCCATTSRPVSDRAFVDSTGILLSVVLASPPPPPPPPRPDDDLLKTASKTSLEIASTIIGSLAGLIAIGGAAITVFKRCRSRRGVNPLERATATLLASRLMDSTTVLSDAVTQPSTFVEPGLSNIEILPPVHHNQVVGSGSVNLESRGTEVRREVSWPHRKELPHEGHNNAESHHDEQGGPTSL